MEDDINKIISEIKMIPRKKEFLDWCEKENISEDTMHKIVDKLNSEIITSVSLKTIIADAYHQGYANGAN